MTVYRFNFDYEKIIINKRQKMKIAKNYVILMFCLFGITSLMSHTFTGNVVEEDSGEPLAGANIVIVGEGKGASCDFDGNFFISNLEEGTYTMIISRVGYKSDTVIISIPDDVFHKIKLKSHAQTMQPVIVTANRTKQNLQDSPVTVTVLDKTAVDDAKAYDVKDVMKNAPGVTMSQESIALRNCSGFSYGVGSRVLLMVDGVPMLAGDSGQIKWDALGLTHIKQIEMVKNAGSALYGSGALGGVINIITEEPKNGSHFHVSTDVGVWDKPYYEQWRWSDETRLFHSINIKHTNTWNDKWSSVFSLSEKMDDSYRMIDYSKRASLFGKVKYAPDASSDFTFSANGSYNDHGQYLDWKNVVEALSVPEEERDDRIFSRRLNVNAIYNDRNIDKKRFITVKAHSFIDDWDSRQYAADAENNLERLYASSSKSGISSQISYNSSDEHHFTVGGDLNLSTVESILYGERIGYGAALFAQDEIKAFDPFKLSIGARGDFFDVPTGKTYYMLNPKAGLVYQAADNIAFRSSFGTGYRVPTMAELFTQVTVSAAEIRPNPELEAETSYSAEIGGNILLPWSTFDVALFSTWYDDMIEPKADEGTTTARFVNLDRSRVMGTEITLNLQAKFGSLSANYLYTDSKDIDTGEKLSYRPDHNVNISGRLKYTENLSLTAAWRYKSDRTFELYPNSPSVPEKVLDIGHNFDFGDYYVTLKVNNVFQYHYSEVEKGIAPIRNFVISAGMDI